VNGNAGLAANAKASTAKKKPAKTASNASGQ
jgi:hypothetical protein